MVTDKCMVIFVDELDRCIPEYAIKVLERIHHLFYGIENLIVVLAVDSKQLTNSIEKIYGPNINIDKYIKKIVDL